MKKHSAEGFVLLLSLLSWGEPALAGGLSTPGQGAFPNTRIIPAQPDADGHEMDLGIGRKMKNWTIDLAYQHAVAREQNASANIYGYDGKYNMSLHLLGLTAAYRF